MSTPSEHPYAAQSAFSSLKRARILFDRSEDPQSVFIPMYNNNNEQLQQQDDYEASLQRRKRFVLGDAAGKGGESIRSGKKANKKKVTGNKSSNALIVSTVVYDDAAAAAADDDDGGGGNDTGGVNVDTSIGGSSALTTYDSIAKSKNGSENDDGSSTSRILVKRQDSASAATKVPRPTWHAPWKLTTVLSSHLGWVRSIAFDPANAMFATGSVRCARALFLCVFFFC